MHHYITAPDNIGLPEFLKDFFEATCQLVEISFGVFLSCSLQRRIGNIETVVVKPIFIGANVSVKLACRTSYLKEFIADNVILKSIEKPSFIEALIMFPENELWHGVHVIKHSCMLLIAPSFFL
ncbi:MAG: hypothetical protein ACOY4M_09360 [Pseudomonadota bacterium]